MRTEVRVVGERMVVRHGGVRGEAPVAAVAAEIARLGHRQPSCPVLPAGTRVWLERGDAVGVCIELPPQARVVRWLSASSRVPFGRTAKYERYFISFPWIEILLVFRRGALTGYQQLYYRRESLDAGEDLLLPNLFNVARGYGQKCWLCLVNLEDLTSLAWPAKIRAVVEHVFGAAFNRSSEVHEQNSLFGAMVKAKIDPRVDSIETWQEATRADPRFALQVPWRAANTTVSAELHRMLDGVVGPGTVTTAEDLAALVALLGEKGCAA